MEDFNDYYLKMLAAKQVGDSKLADELMREIESKRAIEFEKPCREIIDSIKLVLPEFPRSVLGKSQLEVDPNHRANCINAALNFFAESPRMKPFTPDELLTILQDDYQQIYEESHEFADLIVTWTRTYGSWDDRLVNVHEMRKSDPDFPYGLIFDHVMVEVTPLLVFHKPNPNLESCYEIEFFDSVIGASANVFGFEYTRHRALNSRTRKR